MQIQVQSYVFSVDPATDASGIDANSAAKLRFWARMAQGKWEPDLVARFCRSLERPGLVIDVGAWIGPYSLLAAAAERDVIALEPDPDAFGKLLRNRALLPEPRRITPVSGVLWPRPGLVKLHAIAHGDSETSIAGLRRRKSKTVVSQDAFYAPAVSLADIERLVGDRAVSFVKVDIEGAEYENLPSILEFAERRRCDLAIAFHPENLIGLNADLEPARRHLRRFAAAAAPNRVAEIKCGGEWIALSVAALESPRAEMSSELSALSLAWR